MVKRQLISSNSPYEPRVGFSRAVKVGNTVYVSGTVAWDEDGKLVGSDNAYEQAKQTIRNIEMALFQAGSSLRNVVLTRIFVTDIGFLDEVARAHGEAFDTIRPASTMVEVSRLADAEMLVEIEAVAVV